METIKEKPANPRVGALCAALSDPRLPAAWLGEPAAAPGGAAAGARRPPRAEGSAEGGWDQAMADRTIRAKLVAWKSGLSRSYCWGSSGLEVGLGFVGFKWLGSQGCRMFWGFKWLGSQGSPGVIVGEQVE